MRNGDFELQKYLFDLQGYLVIHDIISGDEIAELNRLIDVNYTSAPALETGEGRFGSSGACHEDGGGLLEWGNPFCNLLDHPAVMPLLRFIIGDGFRIDHLYGIDQATGTGPKTRNLHGGGTPYVESEFYAFRDGTMYNGLTVVSWTLVDCGPKQGGFLCVPGSHKANYAMPPQIFHAHHNSECVVIPEAKAGSAIIFTEALSHGTAPWTADFNRRAILYKYDPSYLAYSARQAQPPSAVELTERQRLLFEPPSHPTSFGRRSLFEEELSR
jgi:hypothetical protein